MKINIEYNQQADNRININSARYLGNFAVRIGFNDGTEKLVDFKPFLAKSLHPSIKKYLDESKFSKFEVIDGNLNWNDYDLIFPILDLYNGKVGR
jgi:hypothetical protein